MLREFFNKIFHKGNNSLSKNDKQILGYELFQDDESFADYLRGYPKKKDNSNLGDYNPRLTSVDVEFVYGPIMDDDPFEDYNPRWDMIEDLYGPIMDDDKDPFRFIRPFKDVSNDEENSNLEDYNPMLDIEEDLYGPIMEDKEQDFNEEN